MGNGKNEPGDKDLTLDRRRFIHSVCIGAVGLGTHGANSTTASTDNQQESWSQFGYDSAKTGHAPANTGPGDEVVEQWHFPEFGTMTRSLQVQNETAIVGDRAGNVVALDLADGSERWRFRSGSRTALSPTVTENGVYVGSSVGTVYALDLETGAELWHVDTGGEVWASPAVTDGILFVNSNDELVALNTDDGSEEWRREISLHTSAPPVSTGEYVYVADWDGIIAVDASDGQEQWRFEMNEGMRGQAPPTIANDTLYTGERDGTVYALDASDGDELWTFETDGDTRGSPVVNDGVVYFQGNTTVYALDTSTGSEQWSVDTGGFSVTSSPVIAGETLYINPSNLLAINRDTGDERWQVRKQWPVRDVVVDDDRLIAGTGSEIFALDTDGTEQWSFEMSGPIESSPVVRDETVSIGIDDTLYALDTNTGTEQWSHETAELIKGSPAVVDGIVASGNRGGTVFGLEVDDGTERWRYEGDNIDSAGLTVANGLIYVVSSGSDIDALDPTDGTAVDHFSVSGASTHPPAVTENMLYFATNDGTVHAFDLSNTNEQWQFETGEFGSGGVAVVDETVYYAQRNVHAIDISDETERWEFSTERNQSTSPAITDDAVYPGHHAVDADSGTEQWHFERGRSWGSPVVVDGTTYISEADMLSAVDAATGQTVWTFNTAGTELETSRAASAAVVDGTVYFASLDGRIYAIGDGVTASMTTPSLATTGTELSFSAVESKTTANEITSYEWAFGEDDDYSQAGETTTHTFQETGIYTISLRVTDSDDRQETVSRTIQVHEPVEDQSNVLFQQFSESTDSPLLWALAGGGGLGATYLGYKKFSSSSESSQSTKDEATTGVNSASDTHSESTPSKETDQLDVSTYTDIEIDERVHEFPDVTIRQGEFETNPVWVLTLNGAETDTISVSDTDNFIQNVQQWEQMDAHSNLLHVYGSGTDPLPWAALEHADYPRLIDEANQYRTEELLELLQKICDALHHVHRYGENYENLTIDSVLVTDDAEIKLRGVLDQFDEPDQWYTAPEEGESEDESTEQSTVYRIGLIAYELFTGTLPYADYPDGVAESAIQDSELIPPTEQTDNVSEGLEQVILKTLSRDPSDRYETVLHLRDEIDDITDS